eukprot:6203572-Amphidinium_carterae.1
MLSNSNRVQEKCKATMALEITPHIDPGNYHAARSQMTALQVWHLEKLASVMQAEVSTIQQKWRIDYFLHLVLQEPYKRISRVFLCLRRKGTLGQSGASLACNELRSQAIRSLFKFIAGCQGRKA